MYPLRVFLGAEGVVRVAVAAVDRRAGKAEQKRVRQRRTHLDAEVPFLGAMGLIHERDDVAAIVEHSAGLAELEDRRDDDLAGVLREQLLKVLAGLGLHQVRHVGGVESRADLRVEVDAVDDDEHRRVPERGLQAKLLRGEDHEQRLAGALEVPDEPLSRLAGERRARTIRFTASYC